MPRPEHTTPTELAPAPAKLAQQPGQVGLELLITASPVRPLQPEIARLAEQVASELPFQDESEAQAVHAIGSLVQSFADQPSTSAVAIVERRDSVVRPSLDVYLIWSRPIQLRADAAEMSDLTKEHVVFHHALESLSPAFNSHLDIVDPRRYPSIAQLEKDLVTTPEDAMSTRVLATHSLKS